MAQEPFQEEHSSPESGSPDLQEAGPSHSTDPDAVGESDEVSVERLNKCATILGESPVQLRRLKRSKSYRQQKTQMLQHSVVRNLQSLCPDDSTIQEPQLSSDGAEMIQQLKEKLLSCETTGQKVQVLTILPKSWSIHKIEEEFGVSNYLARMAKDLVEEKGILSNPDPRTRPFPQEIVDRVTSFYKREDISREMPGIKDKVSVMVNGQRVSRTKHLILSNLKEVYQKFKDVFPGTEIGFSKFASLRPKECVLAGASGTHSVCVCTIHQNVKLMIHGAKLASLTAESGHPLTSCKECIASITCNPVTTACFLGSCEYCGSLDDFREWLIQIFSHYMIDEVQYQQWTTTDRSNLETYIDTTEEFVDSFCEKLHTLKRHDFIAQQQSLYLTQRKELLLDNEYIVMTDFAENYSFVLQDAVQGFHWNNAQATVHPFVCYYRRLGVINHVSFVIISDCLNHDTVAVHLYQKHLISFLTNHFGHSPVRMIYFSDGASSQYKNCKNFANLCHHASDFNGILAEWHFFATSHGKGPCDGVLGGLSKDLQLVPVCKDHTMIK